MICYNCGGLMEEIISDLPFRVTANSIVIIKRLPVLQCENCNEYLLDDSVMAEVDRILNRIDKTAELEVLSYAV